METEKQTIFNIPEYNFPEFEKRIEKLSKRAVKLMGEGSEIKPFVFGYHVENKTVMVRNKKVVTSYKVYEILMNYEDPKIGGYEFIAKLDHANDVGNIVRVVPGKTLPELYRTADHTNCDHCKKKIWRRNSYVVRHVDTNVYSQVGGQCLKDFITGGHDVERFAKYAELYMLANEVANASSDVDWEQVHSDNRVIGLEEYLTHCAAAIRIYGWISGSAAYNRDNIISTRERALNSYFAQQQAKMWNLLPVTNTDVEIANSAIEWAQMLDTTSDWAHNVKVISESGIIEYRSAGLSASITGAYVKYVQQETEKKNREDENAVKFASMANSKHVGKVGDKVAKRVKILSRKGFDGNFGFTIIYGMLDEEGNAYTWFCTGTELKFGERNAEVNDVLTIKGTIKAHNVYSKDKDHSVNQTILSRVKTVA